MPACTRFLLHRQGLATLGISLVAALVALPVQSAFGLISGGEGNEPVHDPGWPSGAAVVFNQPTRVAYWVGPPFGGGQWHAECRGDAAALNTVLANFAKIDAKSKRLVLHDGVGHSFWLNPNREPAKKNAAQIDWVFMVWQPKSWEQLSKGPIGVRPSDLGDEDVGPVTQIDVYTGGRIRLADVVVPQNIEVIDERLEAHGFTADDGTVLEGNVIDLETKQPIAARMELQRIERQPQGGYRYTVASRATADTQGHWSLKHAPAGWHRVVILADGYAPRVIGHAQFDGQPGWHSYDRGLSRSTHVSGRVADDIGKPLAEVEVRLDDVICHDELYESPDGQRTTTDGDGRFRFDQVPLGKGRVGVHKRGYCRPGLGLPIETSAGEIVLEMTQSARLRTTVDFGNAKRPEAYIVNIEPEGESGIGSWGGSGHINKDNEFTFTDVPPGRYVVQGHPNPTSENQKTEPVTIELKGGTTADVTITAK